MKPDEVVHVRLANGTVLEATVDFQDHNGDVRLHFWTSAENVIGPADAALEDRIRAIRRLDGKIPAVREYRRAMLDKTGHMPSLAESKQWVDRVCAGSCVCGSPEADDMVHRVDGPCYSAVKPVPFALAEVSGDARQPQARSLAFQDGCPLGPKAAAPATHDREWTVLHPTWDACVHRTLNAALFTMYHAPDGAELATRTRGSVRWTYISRADAVTTFAQPATIIPEGA